MFNLGACFYNGEGGAENAVLAYTWFLAAEAAGNVAAQDAVTRSETELGRSSLLSAIVQLGTMYEKGEDLPRNYAAAAECYRKAVPENLEAVLRLSLLLINGDGVKQDYAQAMGLCHDAAKKGYGPAQWCVGYMYQHGLGVAADPRQAAKWYKPSSRNNASAALALAEMCEKGEGVAIDRPEAYWLLFLAYRAGSREAKLKAQSLHRSFNSGESKRLDKKLRQRRLDPKNVYEVIDDPAPPDPDKVRKAFPVFVR